MVEVNIMGVSYKKLWILIIEKDLKKAQVRQMASVSASTFSKMSKNEYVARRCLGSFMYCP